MQGPKGSKIEAKAGSGCGVAAPLPPARGVRSAVSSSSGVLGGAPTARFHYFQLSVWPLLTIQTLLLTIYSGWPHSRRKNSEFSRLFQSQKLLFHRLLQQKVNVIMTFIKGHSTSTTAI